MRPVEACIFGFVVFENKSNGGKESKEDCISSHKCGRVLLEGFGLGNAGAVVHV